MPGLDGDSIIKEVRIMAWGPRTQFLPDSIGPLQDMLTRLDEGRMYVSASAARTCAVCVLTLVRSALLYSLHFTFTEPNQRNSL